MSSNQDNASASASGCVGTQDDITCTESEGYNAIMWKSHGSVLIRTPSDKSSSSSLLQQENVSIPKQDETKLANAKAVILSTEITSFRPHLSVSPLTITSNLPPFSRYVIGTPNDCINPSIKCMIVPPIAETNDRIINVSRLPSKDRTSLSDPNITKRLSSLMAMSTLNMMKNNSKMRPQSREILGKNRQNTNVRCVSSLANVERAPRVYRSKGSMYNANSKHIILPNKPPSNSLKEPFKNVRTGTSSPGIEALSKYSPKIPIPRHSKSLSSDVSSSSVGTNSVAKTEPIMKRDLSNTCVTFVANDPSNALTRPKSSVNVYKRRRQEILKRDQSCIISQNEVSKHNCIKHTPQKFETVIRPTHSVSKQRMPGILSKDIFPIKSHVNTNLGSKESSQKSRVTIRPFSSVKVCKPIKSEILTNDRLSTMSQLNRNVRSRDKSPPKQGPEKSKAVTGPNSSVSVCKSISPDILAKVQFPIKPHLSRKEGSKVISVKEELKNSKTISRTISSMNIYRQNNSMSFEKGILYNKTQLVSNNSSGRVSPTENYTLLTRPISSASIIKQNMLKDYFITDRGPSANFLEVSKKKYLDAQVSVANDCTHNLKTVKSKSYSAIKDKNEVPPSSVNKVGGDTSNSSPVLKDVANEINYIRYRSKKPTMRLIPEGSALPNMEGFLLNTFQQGQSKEKYQPKSEVINGQVYEFEDIESDLNCSSLNETTVQKNEIEDVLDADINQALIKFSNLSIYDDAEDAPQRKQEIPFSPGKQVAGDEVLEKSGLHVEKLSSFVQYAGSGLQNRKAQKVRTRTITQTDTEDLRRRLEGVAELRKHLMLLLDEIEEERERVEKSREFCVEEIEHFKEYFNQYFYVPLWQIRK